MAVVKSVLAAVLGLGILATPVAASAYGWHHHRHWHDHHEWHDHHDWHRHHHWH